MIIRVLIAVVLAVPAYFYTMRYNMHMFQQNGYKNKEHLHWLKKKFRLQWILYFGLALGIVTCVFPYLALEIFEYLILLVIIVVYRAMKRMNTKKKLVYTARVKRLLATELIFTAAVFALVCGLGGMKRIPGLCLILVSVNLFLDIVANVIILPMEAGSNQHYINDAVRKLKSVPGLTVIGVTGSYGKTSVKFYLQTLLQEKYNVLVTPESFNTPMGVVRTIRGSLKPTTEIFVCEMGARHVGDIKEICDMVHPDHGVITSIGPQHLETFFNMENIQKTKFELADALPQVTRVYACITYGSKSIPVVTLTALTCAEATHTELEVGGVYYGEVKRENGQVLSARLYDMAALYQLAGLVGTMRDSKTAEQVFHQLIWMNEHRED